MYTCQRKMTKSKLARKKNMEIVQCGMVYGINLRKCGELGVVLQSMPHLLHHH